MCNRSKLKSWTKLQITQQHTDVTKQTINTTHTTKQAQNSLLLNVLSTWLSYLQSIHCKLSLCNHQFSLMFIKWFYVKSLIFFGMLLLSEVIPLYSWPFSSHWMVLKNKDPLRIEVTNKSLTKQCYCLVRSLVFFFSFCSFLITAFFLVSNILQNSKYTWCGRFAQHFVSLKFNLCLKVSNTVYSGFHRLYFFFKSLTSMANFSCFLKQS